MNRNPAPQEGIALLGDLKATIREFIGREEKLTTELRLKTGAEQKNYEAQSAEQEARLADRIAAAEQEFESAKEKSKTRFEKRKARITRAHAAVRKRVMDGIRDLEGQRKYKIQESAMDAERRRDSLLAETTHAFEEFKLKIADAGGLFEQTLRNARGALRGFGGLKKLLAADRTWPEPDVSADHGRLFEEIQRLQGVVQKHLEKLRGRPLLQLFKWMPLWFATILLLGFAVAVPALQKAGVAQLPWQAAAAAVAAWVALIVLHVLGSARTRPEAMSVAGDLAKMRRLLDVSFEKSVHHQHAEQERIKREFADSTQSLNRQWRETVKGTVDMRGVQPVEVDRKAMGVTQKNEELQKSAYARIDREHSEVLARVREEESAERTKLEETHKTNLAKIEADSQEQWNATEKEWTQRIQPIYDAVRAANASAQQLFPGWEAERWATWKPPQEFVNAAKFGSVEVDVEKFAEGLPKDRRLALPGPAQFSFPLLLTYPGHGSILFEASKTGHQEAVASLNNIIFRLLSTTPPGKLSLTILDPVGLGQNFAGLMHLADYEGSNIHDRIWTQSGHIDEKLAELSEHMEKVIQMYLRNEYETIAEYNAQAGTIAEKYYVLVVASFPANFSDTATARLRNIASSGARCGVYTLIHWDQRKAIPHEFVPDELRKNSICLVRTDRGVELSNWRAPGIRIVLDPPPSSEFATQFLHQVGQSSKDSNRVEVPFEQVAPPNSDLWTEETTDELRVAIGRSGATKLQYLEIGKGTRQHGLIAGKTGSGKSTLFHVIVTNLALWCSPEQVEFYLVDFKKGVEFKCYANRRLPHAKVVAIESDRQFGLSVLQRVDDELRRRGDLFRKLGVQDLPGYKKAGGKEPMPRTLLVIDEFQEFFVEEDRVSQGAAVLLDRIVRQGRAFGIHALLGSQTLGGAYTLARATLGQMVIRVALQCNEADAYLIMDQDNPAPRLLSRPGEGIYNDAAGAIEGNSPFQAVWLPEEVRDAYLAKVRVRADRNGKDYPGPFVFEGNAAADVRENALLASLLKAEPSKPAAPPRTWLGAPNSIKGPTEVVFQRQSGSNVLIVGQNEEASLTLISVMLVALAGQYPPGTARFVLLDSSTPDTAERAFLDRVLAAIPNEVIRPKAGDLAEAMAVLAEDLKRRDAEDQGATAPETFVFVYGLQNFKKLRQEDEFSFTTSDSGGAAQPAAILLSLINDGPAHGFHVVATCDTYNNVNRFLGRKNLTQFEMRVLFQMSASDSASLIDAPDASTLGLHRALYYNDREGYLETFRPYARPPAEWVEEVARLFSRQPV